MIAFLLWEILDAAYCDAYMSAISYRIDFELHESATGLDIYCFEFDDGIMFLFNLVESEKVLHRFHYQGPSIVEHDVCGQLLFVYCSWLGHTFYMFLSAQGSVRSFVASCLLACFFSWTLLFNQFSITWKCAEQSRLSSPLCF